jgi:CheY-like chemotaxis protein
MFGGQAARQGLQISGDVDDDVPARIHGDQFRLRQMLANLVANAIKFTPQGAVRVRVSTLTLEGDEALLRFEVRDTGIGVDDRAAIQLFQPFTQADGSTTRRYGGTGLGLAITRQLAEAMHGEAGLESVVGEGSTFWFTILARVAQRSPEGGPAGVAQPPRRALPARILVAEDNLVNMKLAVAQLARLGHTADTAANGVEALEAMQRAVYDVVLMDCQMPLMDGFVATAEIRRLEGDDRHTTVIAMTANALPGDREACLDSGMDDYLPKPVRVDDLRMVLERWLPSAVHGRAG